MILDENFDQQIDQQPIPITIQTAGYLLNAGRSAMKIAILGLLFSLSLIALITYYIYTGHFTQSGIGGTIFSVSFGLAITLLPLVSSFYLWRFSNTIKPALIEKDADKFSASFINLKSMFKFTAIYFFAVIGILAIMMLLVSLELF